MQIEIISICCNHLVSSSLILLICQIDSHLTVLFLITFKFSIPSLLLRDSRIAELTNKHQFGKYAFSRLRDSEIFYYTRTYLASFHLNNFRNYKKKIQNF